MKITLPQECIEIYEHCTKNLLEAPSASPGMRLNEEQVQEALPQRNRMLLIDTVSYLDLEHNYIRAHCDLSKRKDILDGHYPNRPIWPGVLQIESMGQAGQILWTLQHSLSLHVVQITHIFNTRFMSPIIPPGIVEVRAQSFENGLFVVSVAQSIFKDKICSLAIIQAVI